MGKRRNRRRHRQKSKRNLYYEFRSQSLIQTLEDENEREAYKLKEQEYHKKRAEIKQDLLRRTVLVLNIKPLGDAHKIMSFRRFFEQFGPVQKCELERKHARVKFPRRVVQFHYKEDAEKIFGGTSLAEARKARAQEKIPCPSVGHKKFLLVRPSLEYTGMVEDDFKEYTKLIKINTEELSFGHWFPSGTDAGASLPELEEQCANDPGIWLEEKHTHMNPILTFNLEKSVVELDVTHCNISGMEDILGLLSAMDVYIGTRVVASFRFKDLAHRTMEICQCEGLYYIVFSLKHPPRLTSISVNRLTGWETRTRLTSIEDIGADTFGNCLGYRLRVSETEINSLLLMNLKAFEKLQNFGLFRMELGSLLQAEPCRTIKVTANQQHIVKARIARLDTRLGLLLQSLLDNHTCCWFDLLNDEDQGLFDLLEQGNRVLVEKVLADMSDAHGRTRYPAQVFWSLYQAGVDADDTLPRTTPQFCVDLPRILITPCRVCVTGFQVEMSNRLVRKFIQNHSFSAESFLRVTIGDENGDKLFSDDLKDGEVAPRISNLVLNGIEIVGKKYHFLAYSSSQLKELSLWMVCPEHGWSVERMRDSMGDFSMCSSPSKYAARIGQCFSTTVDTTSHGTGATAGHLRVKHDLPDITCYNNETGTTMEHSDGVGVIRKDLLEEIMRSHPFGPSDPCDVSAIQIRYGGAKGVLVGWELDVLRGHRCHGYDVFLGPSMVKFKAPYDRLEVVTIASRIPYYLNRNVILLLKHHGIPDRTFLDMQNEMLVKLNQMLTDPRFAASFLPCLSGPDSRLVSSLVHMLAFGLEPDKDPFLFSCLHATRAHHLMNLRKKARIHVEKGAVLIGGIDETGLVPEGCIFLQVRRSGVNSADDGGGFEPIQGPVMVTKHPVMHPGDTRMLLAVDIEELRDKRNVVLFSQHGDRPEADKMSGSDLDGDQFAVTWDERLFLSKTSPPMDYSPPKKPTEDEGHTDAALIKHFINHARNDNLGRIAMLWLDHAVENKDAGCEECIELAKLHSIAVDFPKSGIPAEVPKDLVFPSKHPRAHWREKKGTESFHCDSIVGQLYDQIVREIKAQRNPRAAGQPRAPFKAMAGRDCDKNGQILIVGKPQSILESKESIYNPLLPGRLGWDSDDLGEMLQDFANDQREQYESQLISLMNQYKIKCEGEVVTGCIMKYHKLHKRRQHDVSEEIRRQFRSIRNEFRSEFFRAVYHLVEDNMDFFSNEIILQDDNGDEKKDDEAKDWYDVEADDLVWMASAVTTKTTPNAARGGFDDKTVAARRYASRLAAAYYISAYSPAMHAPGSTSVFYSFPWVVAADVFARSLQA